MPDTTTTHLRVVARTDRANRVEDRLWETLHGNPGKSAAELAGIAGIGRSTATKLLAAWAKEGSVTRTSGIATGGRRVADRWTITPDTSDLQARDGNTTEEDGATPARLTVVTDHPTDNDPAGVVGELSTSNPEGAAAPDEKVTAEVATHDPAVSVSSRHAASVTVAPAPPAADASVESPSTGSGASTRTRTPSSVPKATGQKRGRLAKGALRGMVEDFLIAHQGEAFGPAMIGKALGRSGGAVANALEKLVADGYVIRVADSPKRYQVIPQEGSAAGDASPDGE
ncbi:MarR family transcriptional regulator [Actinoalloteichus caeruleus]|uniref:MarR family transcriptional regulator n=1 Tax=Actinoalloteichus cyanogriseus TaxID=2893586 RepID=UPI003AAA3456